MFTASAKCKCIERHIHTYTYLYIFQDENIKEYAEVSKKIIKSFNYMKEIYKHLKMNIKH